MSDRVYTEGFPDRWSMVHRDDCTLLVRRADMGFLVVPSQAVCMAPKLMQGEAWLDTAKEIAHALAGSHERELSRIFAEFCDECGIGPPHDENDQPRPNIRAVKTWTCDRCGHVNTRPVTKADPAPPSQDVVGVDLIAKIAETANGVGWQAGEPAMELAGQIVSVLAAHPEHIDRFMAEGTELFLDGTFNIEHGSLTYRAINGSILSPSVLREKKGQQQ